MGADADADGGSTLWLTTGVQFDVVEVPEQAGRQAVRRLLAYRQAVLAPGPVGLTGPGRCGFLVAPGAREDLPELLDWLDWGGIELGMRAYGQGEEVRAPGPQDWLHDPVLYNPALPDQALYQPVAPMPEVIALLATIAEECWLAGLSRSAPPAGVIAPRGRPQ